MLATRQLERRLSNLKIPSSILPCMVDAVLVILFPHVARGRPWPCLLPGRPEPRSGVRFLARLGPPSGVTLDVPIFGPLGRWGRSDLCRDDTQALSSTGGHFLREATLPAGRKKKHSIKRTLSALTCHNIRSGTCFINKMNSSQYGPYLLASFHACAVTRICRISGTHMWRPQCLPQRPLQHSFQGDHLRKGVHADCSRTWKHRFTTFNCSVRMGVLRTTCPEHFSIEIQAAFGPPCSSVLRAGSRGSGLFLTVDERLEEVSISARMITVFTCLSSTSTVSRVSFMVSLNFVSVAEASSHFCS